MSSTINSPPPQAQPILRLTRPPQLSLSHPVHPFQTVQSQISDAFFTSPLSSEQQEQPSSMPLIVSHSLLGTDSSLFSVDLSIVQTSAAIPHLYQQNATTTTSSSSSSPAIGTPSRTPAHTNTLNEHSILWKLADLPSASSEKSHSQASQKHNAKTMHMSSNPGAPKTLQFSKSSSQLAAHFVHDMIYDSKSNMKVKMCAVKSCEYVLLSTDETTVDSSTTTQRKRKRDQLSPPKNSSENLTIKKHGLRALCLMNDHTLHIVTEDGHSWSIQEAINSINNDHWKEDFETLVSAGSEYCDQFASRYVFNDSKGTSEIGLQVPSPPDLFKVFFRYYNENPPVAITAERESSRLSKEEKKRIAVCFEKTWTEMKCPVVEEDDDIVTEREREIASIKESRRVAMRQKLTYLMKKKKLPDDYRPSKKRKTDTTTSTKDIFHGKGSKPNVDAIPSATQAFLKPVLQWSLSTVSCMDIMRIKKERNLYVIAVGFKYGSFCVIQSELKDATSDLEEIFRYVYPHNTLNVSLIKLVWVNTDQLLMAYSDGSVSVAILTPEDGQLRIQINELHPPNDLPVIDLMHDEGKDRNFIVIVSSLSAIIYSYQGNILERQQHVFRSPFSNIRSVQIMQSPVQGSTFAYIAVENFIIEWNMTLGTFVRIELPGDFEHRKTEIHGVLLSPNGLVLYALLQKQNEESIELVPMPVFPLNALAGYLEENLSRMRGTDDLFTYCRLCTEENPLLNLANTFRGFEKKNAHLRRILYRVSPLISKAKHEEMFKYAMYHVAMHQVENLPEKHHSRIIFCDWLLLLFQQDPSTILLTKQVLQLMLHAYRDFKETSCERQVENLLNLVDENYIDKEDALEELKKFAPPVRDRRLCDICGTKYPANVVPFNQLVAPCGHRVILDISTLLPLEGTKYYLCNACGSLSSEEMRMCRLCGHEHCVGGS